MTNHTETADKVADAIMSLPRPYRIAAATTLAIGTDTEVANLIERLTA